jgi:diguanylate cyclase (GGDEF)-like protein/PAS domain S-box-containing protein
LRDLYLDGPQALGKTVKVRTEDVTHLLADAFDSTTEGIFITDARGDIVMVNPAFSSITGYQPREVIGKNPRFLKSGQHSVAFYRDMWRSLHDSGRWHGEIYNRRKDGEIYLQELSISTVVDDYDEVRNYVAIFADITSRKDREERLEYLATHDSLTDLPNRALFYDRLNHALTRAQRNQCLVAVMFLDLDGFKEVNDTYGHALGDRLLKAVAQRLESCVRQSDTMARLGGDEFAGLIDELTSLAGATIVAQNLITALEKPFLIDAVELSVTGSIGVSVYPIDGGNADLLLRKADVAMYRAKSRGKNNFQFHTPWR